MDIQLDDSVLAYASASYAEQAVVIASENPGALKRMVQKIQDLVRQHGKKILRHTAVLALVSATVLAVDKALEYPRIARRLALTTGRLKSVTEVAALGFALYKLVSALLAAVTPTDDGYGTPSMQQRLRELDQRNEELRRSVDEVQEKLHNKVANQDRNRGVENVREIDEARRRRDIEKRDEENEEEENPDSSYDGPPLPGPLEKLRRKKEPMQPAHASTETPVTALTVLRDRFPNAVTTRELYPEVQPAQVEQDIRFLRKIESLDANRRDGYAKRLASNPEMAQGFVDRVFSILRRMRRDPVGAKVHKLGSFVVKWGVIFTVQSIMFKMLVHITKSSVFNAIGGMTRFVLSCLCAVNSVLLLVHSAGPESEDTQTIHSIRTSASRSKVLVNRLAAA